MKSNLYLICVILLVAFIAQLKPLKAQGFKQTQVDSYTRYELLSPSSQTFRIYYDVSATTAGAKYYFNTLRKGSEHSINEVIDLMTGEKLKWKIVNGMEAKRAGLLHANNDGEYLQVFLARPVPKGGQARIRIDKNYKDTNSYFTTDSSIVFERSLGIRRNSLVLPLGYELISCNYPSQLEQLDDNRIKVSFMNIGNTAVRYRVEAREVEDQTKVIVKEETNPFANHVSRPGGRDKSVARIDYKLNERAFQNRDIVYFLQQPETHAFRLYHDYTESRPGTDKYLNVVRAGSKATNPSAMILDTGEQLKVETLKGDAITEKGIQLSMISPETEVVVIWFDPVQKGQSVRLRIEETYTDANRYLLHNDELIWDRSFGRNRNTVILPEGWYLTTSSIPAIIDQTEKGQPRLRFVNPRPDNIDVFIKGRRK